ncbi:hypothetical protein C8J57DRAFT_62636 [Mycena rebaudengoi]|nr:hypothetical protein C8J57DRAFT_62636 [Mycena rebaudengoi]
MHVGSILFMLISATDILRGQAAVQNISLAAGTSSNITLNGSGWWGPGGWQGLKDENTACNASTDPVNKDGKATPDQGTSVTVLFQGTAVYFVGWNNSRNGVYQPYIDGVPDSPVTAYIPVDMPWKCNVVQFKRTGLTNAQHNLTIALLPDDPGKIKIPGLSVNGFIITTDDDPVLPVTSTDIDGSIITTGSSSSASLPTSTPAASSAPQASSALRPTNSAADSSGSPPITTDVSRIPSTSTTGSSLLSTTTGSSHIPLTSIATTTTFPTAAAASDTNERLVPPSISTDSSFVPLMSIATTGTFPTILAGSSVSPAAVQVGSPTDDSLVSPSATYDSTTISTFPTTAVTGSTSSAAVQVTSSTVDSVVPPSTTIDSSSASHTVAVKISAAPHTKPTTRSSVSTASTAVQPTKSTSDDSVPPSSTVNVGAVLPTSATANSGFPLATTVATTDSDNIRGLHPNTGPIIGSAIAAIIGLLAIAALGNLASQVIQAKKASKPGANAKKSREFIFVFPPYFPRPKKEKIKSHQITLTLAPVDIEDDYTYQQVVWQRFNIDDGSSEFSAKFNYDRGFGTANIKPGRDEINGVSFCDRPLAIGHAKPGRIIPLKGSAWANALEFIIRKYTRITARNDSEVPLRLVIGTYNCVENDPEAAGEGNVEGTEEHDYLVRSQSAGWVEFQSFVIMDDPIHYAETLSASFDLTLRAYKTHDVDVGQILSPSYLRDKAVPLLGEGIRISKLPKIATWNILSNDSGIELARERTTRRKSSKRTLSWGQIFR